MFATFLSNAIVMHYSIIGSACADKALSKVIYILLSMACV
jgi:hypothetical protein